MLESIHIIKQFVDAGKKVAYQTESNQVVLGMDGQYYIKIKQSDHSIELVNQETGEINGDLEDFYLVADLTLEEFRSSRINPQEGPGPIYYPDQYQIIQMNNGEYLVECSNWRKTFKSLYEAEECLWEEWKDS